MCMFTVRARLRATAHRARGTVGLALPRAAQGAERRVDQFVGQYDPGSPSGMPGRRTMSFSGTVEIVVLECWVWALRITGLRSRGGGLGVRRWEDYGVPGDGVWA